MPYTLMSEQDPGKPVKSTILLPPDLHRLLHLLAKQHKRSLQGEMIWALEQYAAQEALLGGEPATKPEQEAV